MKAKMIDKGFARAERTIGDLKNVVKDVLNIIDEIESLPRVGEVIPTRANICKDLHSVCLQMATIPRCAESILQDTNKARYNMERDLIEDAQESMTFTSHTRDSALAHAREVRVLLRGIRSRIQYCTPGHRVCP